MDSDKCRGALQVEDLPRELLQVSDQLIEVGRFAVDIGEPGAHLTRFSDKAGVIGKNMANSV
ncbi:MAG TPA: hypothetical protein VHP34_09125 [Alphaproteobacteria bacterium]|nr:hypothetical protein [Alphaproteobacteria bacterium]